MEKLFIFQKDDVIRARMALPHEVFTDPRIWKDIQFEIISSQLMMITWPILLPELSPESARSLLELIGARYPFSTKHEELKKTAPELIFKGRSEEWVFFGGSFNPWHKGHQACLDLLPQDKTCFILPDRNPQKEVRQVEPVYTTISLIARIKFGKNHFIAPSFLLEQEKNPTISWIERLHQEFPDRKLSLLMGFDGLKGLPTWVRYGELLPKLTTIYVVSRREKDEERERLINELTSAAPNLSIVQLGRHPFEHLSSTEIRQ